jgi:hypothetical protein
MVSTFEGGAHRGCAVCVGIVRKTSQSVLRIVRVRYRDFISSPFLDRRRCYISHSAFFKTPLLCRRRNKQPMVEFGGSGIGHWHSTYLLLWGSSCRAYLYHIKTDAVFLFVGVLLYMYIILHLFVCSCLYYCTRSSSFQLSSLQQFQLLVPGDLLCPL